MKLIYLTIAITVVFSACMTTDKAQRYLEKKGQLPRICADKFPPTVTPGTVIFKRDSVLVPGPVVECPPAKTDSATGKPEKVYVHCPPSKIYHDTIAQHDTIENFARIVAQKHQIDSLNTELTVSQRSETKARKQAKNRLFLLIGLGAAFGAGLFLKLKNII